MERYEYIKRRLAGRRGAYLLFFKLVETYHGRIGSLGEVSLPKGTYVYIGSGLGPGGVWSRIKRHITRAKEKKHWHIDYLTGSRYFKPFKIIVVEDDTPLEEKLVEILLGLGYYSIAYPRFGSTDKKSPSHLLVVNGGEEEEIISETVRRLRRELGRPLLVLDI